MLISALLHISEINRGAHGTQRESESQVISVQNSTVISINIFLQRYSVNTSDVFTAGSRDYTRRVDSIKIRIYIKILSSFCSTAYSLLSFIVCYNIL